MGLWRTAPPVVVAAAASEEDVDWYEEVKESEDDVLVSVVSFVINQTIAFASTSQLHGIMTEYSPVHQWEVNFWFHVLVVFFLMSFGVFLFRAQLAHKGWFGGMVQRILLGSMGFSLYRMSNWQVRLLVGDDYAMEHILCAVAFSTLSVAVVIIVDRTANLIAQIAPGWAVQLQFRAQGARRMTPFEWAMHTTIKILGLLVGASWSNAFANGYSDLITSCPTLEQHETLSKLVLSVALVFLAMPGWRRTILPMAEMTEQMHQEAIDFEQSHLRAGESFAA